MTEEEYKEKTVQMCLEALDEAIVVIEQLKGHLNGDNDALAKIASVRALAIHLFFESEYFEKYKSIASSIMEDLE